MFGIFTPVFTVKLGVVNVPVKIGPDILDFKFKLDCKSIPFKERDGTDKLELSVEPPASNVARLVK